MTQTDERVNIEDPVPDDRQGSALQVMASRHRVAQAQQQAQFAAALRVAFGRMAADCPGLDAVVQNVDIRQGGLAEILDLTESGMFLALLEGREDTIGMVMACPSLLAGMIEAQTTGQVDSAPAPRRKPTRTDAALVAPMIDAFLRLVDQRCAELPQAALVSGYVYGSYLDDPRPLGILLEDGSYHLIAFRISLGFGAKDGTWFLILPDPKAPAPTGQTARSEADDSRDWQARLETAVSGSEVVIRAMLGRVQITLTDALRLRPGDVLSLPETALEALTLESITRERLGIGRLGQARGQRAVRLTADPGVLSDVMGAQAAHLALPARIIPFTPPQAVFVPEDAAPAPAPDSQGDG
ncbi:MAG: FliM/FliN family flagellar motor switch protein [Roseinatronobacter sp.]